MTVTLTVDPFRYAVRDSNDFCCGRSSSKSVAEICPLTPKKVELVGDFNGWDGSRTTLVRQANTGLWTLTIPLTPGRHVYAFVVNDSVWTLDPRAAKAKDSDFGTEQSVIVVGHQLPIVHEQMVAAQ